MKGIDCIGVKVCNGTTQVSEVIPEFMDLTNIRRDTLPVGWAKRSVPNKGLVLYPPVVVGHVTIVPLPNLPDSRGRSECRELRNLVY